MLYFSTKKLKRSDVLVIGSGIAGLTFAVKLGLKRPDLSITVLTKVNRSESNTKYAQGGVAAVWDFEKDSYDKHIADTLDAGDGLCDEDVVEFVVKEGPVRVKEIIDWGARFDLEKVGANYDLGKEGGHSENRILHYKDVTGWEMQRTLVDKVATLDNVEILENYFCIELITQHHLGRWTTRVTPDIECYGTYALDLNTNKIFTLLARTTILAAGGAGQIYRNTTNPVIATGDGIAMAFRANARVQNMEFVQFHPTALFNPSGENPSFLVSEAVRGYGAILKYADGTDFMKKYDERGSLAPRDIVARAIDNEMKVLYACGEVTCSGLHGANRLASNSLLEAMVFAHRINEQVLIEIDNAVHPPDIPEWNAEGTTKPKEMVLITQSIKELREIMSNYVGIVRTNVRLKRALDRLHLLYKETEALYAETTISPQICELRNLITIAYLVTKSASMRRESVGLNFNTDFPEKLSYLEHTIL